MTPVATALRAQATQFDDPNYRVAIATPSCCGSSCCCCCCIATLAVTSTVAASAVVGIGASRGIAKDRRNLLALGAGLTIPAALVLGLFLLSVLGNPVAAVIIATSAAYFCLSALLGLAGATPSISWVLPGLVTLSALILLVAEAAAALGALAQAMNAFVGSLLLGLYVAGSAGMAILAGRRVRRYFSTPGKAG